MYTLIEKEIQAATARGELDFVDILIDINTDNKIGEAANALIREKLLQVDIYSACDSM